MIVRKEEMTISEVTVGSFGIYRFLARLYVITLLVCSGVF